MKAMMKILTLLLFAVFTTGLVSCGGDEEEDPTPNETLESFFEGSWVTEEVTYEDIDYTDFCGQTLEAELRFDGYGSSVTEPAFRAIDLDLNGDASATMVDPCLKTYPNRVWEINETTQVLTIKTPQGGTMLDFKIESINDAAGTAIIRLTSSPFTNDAPIGMTYRIRKQ